MRIHKNSSYEDNALGMLEFTKNVINHICHLNNNYLIGRVLAKFKVMILNEKIHVKLTDNKFCSSIVDLPICESHNSNTTIFKEDAHKDVLRRKPSIFETTSATPLVETTTTLKEGSNQFVVTSLARPLVEAALTSEEVDNQFFFLFIFSYFVIMFHQFLR